MFGILTLGQLFSLQDSCIEVAKAHKTLWCSSAVSCWTHQPPPSHPRRVRSRTRGAHLRQRPKVVEPSVPWQVATVYEFEIVVENTMVLRPEPQTNYGRHLIVSCGLLGVTAFLYIELLQTPFCTRSWTKGQWYVRKRGAPQNYGNFTSLVVQLSIFEGLPEGLKFTLQCSCILHCFLCTQNAAMNLRGTSNTSRDQAGKRSAEWWQLAF